MYGQFPVNIHEKRKLLGEIEILRRYVTRHYFPAISDGSSGRDASTSGDQMEAESNRTRRDVV